MKPRKRNPTLPRSFVPPKKEKKVLEPVVINRSYLQEGFALLFLALGIFCATALFSSFQSLSFLKDVGFQQNLNTLLANNYMGDVGRRISIFLISSLGFCSIAVVICPFIVSFRIWFNNSQPLPDTLKGIMSIFVNGAMMVIALATLMAVFMNHKGGGNLGVTIARKLDVNVGAGGTFLISFFVALSFFSLCTGLKVSKMVTFFVKLWRTFKAVLVDKLKEIRAENAFLQDKDLNPINLIFETVKFTFHIIAVTLFTVFFTVPHILFVKARREIVRFLSDKFSYDFTNKKNHALDNFKVVKTKKGTLHLQFDVNKKLKNEIRKNKKKGEKLEEEDTDTEFKLGDNPRRSKLRISRVKGDNKKKEGNKLLTKLKKKITPKEEKRYINDNESRLACNL